MSKIAALKSRIEEITRSTSIYDSGSSIIPKPNYKEIEARIKPIELGRQMGAQGYPEKGSTSPDDIELKIVNTYQEMLFQTSERATEALSAYNQRITALDLGTTLDEIRDTCRSAISDFKAVVHRETTKIANAFDRMRDREADLKTFRDEKQLRRSAHYPTEAGFWVRRAIVLALFLIETIATATFLAKSNEAGFIGAYGEAIAFAVVNIGFSLLIGVYGLRFIHSPETLPKLGAVVLLVTGFSLAVAMNLTLAHYREVAGAGLLGDVGRDALNQMTEALFGFKEVQSWILFVMGLLFWFVALVDGYGMDDPYPGYGRVDRAFRQAQVDYDNLKRDSIDDLAELKDDGEQDIQRTRGELGQVQSQIGALFALKTSLRTEWEKFTLMCQSHSNQMVASYRSANRESRDPRSVPKSFSIDHVLTIPSLGEDTLSITMDKIADQIADARASLTEAHDGFYREFDTAVERIAAIEGKTNTNPSPRADELMHEGSSHPKAQSTVS